MMAVAARPGRAPPLDEPAEVGVCLWTARVGEASVGALVLPNVAVWRA